MSSTIPSISLAKLQELKLWQGSLESLLQQQQNNKSGQSRSSNNNSNSKTNNSSLDNSFNSMENRNLIHNDENWDQKRISPTKPFEQLLEEQLAEEKVQPNDDEDNVKIIKRPFLKKGQGLARFKMGPFQLQMSRNNKKLKNMKNPSGTNKGSSTNQKNSNHVEKKGILKKTPSSSSYLNQHDFQPLTVPDFIKPRGTWKQVLETGKENVGKVSDDDRESLENYEQFRKSLGPDEDEHIIKENKISSYKQQLNGFASVIARNKTKHTNEENIRILKNEILKQVTEYSENHSNNNNNNNNNKARISLFKNEIPKHFSEIQPASTFPLLPMGDLTLEELKIQNELKIFETLEKKVENNSFCSTNTSIVNLLVSTPKKIVKPIENLKIQEEEDEENSVHVNHGQVIKESELYQYIPESVQQKLIEVSRKTDVLHQFLLNLQEVDDISDHLEENSSFYQSSDKAAREVVSSTSSFSEENTRWSSRSPSLHDQTTCPTSDICNKAEVGVNTSFDLAQTFDETLKNCKNCEEFRRSNSETRNKMFDLKSENGKLRNEIKDLQRNYDKIKKSSVKDEKLYQEKMEKLENEISSEKKRFAKERAYFESYVKEAQNRPNKKEREEITHLKQELADIKELVKLKDTKSGATQARLRTQIKQQEKELLELKTNIEKLQKENAKLTASQKYLRRPQDAKMLQEINKNLTKLTEQTLEKQLNKNGNGDGEPKDLNNTKKNATTDKENLDQDESQRNVTAKFLRDCKKPTKLEGALIEKQYDKMFGNFSEPKSLSCSNGDSLEKIEKTLPDGSIEINYSNGNLKTVSPNGKLIKIRYFNGDTKEVDLTTQVIKYHYESLDCWHYQLSDGSEYIEFKDGHKCTKLPDGKIKFTYQDGSLRIINPDKTEEQTYPDGRKVLKNNQGECIILLPNGQREIHTSEYKRREYPDGTIRTLHNDGTVETVYPNGRVRIKDINGVLVLDTHQN